MEVTVWLELIGLGLVCGLIGQALRVLVGLKKMSKQKDAAAVGVEGQDVPFSSGRLIVSLLIGAIAGALAAVSSIADVQSISSQAVIGLAAAGYAGTDFIEGLLKGFVAPGQQPAAVPEGGRG
ncbi:hypothetical protein [Labrenzia sp. VG12]|uniref:hypothetical protein n=1 Tax=Labrenzia sp. VG12 TaxID=2021862 RepID=UPI000B8BD8A3|nr:hypothetical protein [Labrenzia sp. VG12]ASP32783.1 hypothetical protein CHH27_05585 [Labrenzia sp. VG12]